jgi:predicted dehydrogenase
MLQICHVLRYTSFFAQVREVLHSGRLGQAITVSLRENVSAWHIAHSFVRGSWRRADLSSPMILAKCCHDLDILGWLLDRRVTRLSSVGGLTHFRPENAPEGAPTRCTDGCPAAENCPYYAPAIYLDLEPIKRGLTHARNPLFRAAAKLSLSNPAAFNALAVLIPILRRLRDYDGHPRSVISDDPTNPAALLEALKTGPYGRCVYHCDNDVVDHQVVLMEYEGGLSATLTMHGHSEEEGRTIRIDGSQASLFGKFGWGDTYLEIRDHRGGRIERFNYPNALEGGAGHGDADDNLMRAFADALHGDPDAVKSNARDSLEGHLLAFAAEEARLNGSVIEMDAFRARADSLGAAYVL